MSDSDSNCSIPWTVEELNGYLRELTQPSSITQQEGKSSRNTTHQVEPLEKLTEWYEAQGGIDSALSAGFARYEALGDLLPQQKQRINSRWTADQLLTQLQRVLNDGGTAVMVDPLMTIVSATFSDEAKDAFEPIRSYISDRFKGTAKPTQVVIDYLKRRIHQRIEDVWNSAYGEWRAELAKLRPKSCGPDVPTEGGSRK